MPWTWDDVVNLPWGEIGHGALDLAGLVPVLGEAADVANAAWYALEGDFLNAGLSLISVIPVVGDLIGKGGKLVTKLGPDGAAKVLEALGKIDIGKFLEGFKNHPKLGPYIAKIEEALKKWQTDLQAKFGKDKPAGSAKQDCPEPKGEKPKKTKKEEAEGKLGKELLDKMCKAMCGCTTKKGRGARQGCMAAALRSGSKGAGSNIPGLLLEVSMVIPDLIGGAFTPVMNKSGEVATQGEAISQLTKNKQQGGRGVRWDMVLVKDPSKPLDMKNMQFIEVKFKGDKYTKNQLIAIERLGESVTDMLVTLDEESCECG